MEVQVYAKEPDSEKWVTALMNANPSAGHLYNYINKGLTQFSDYFPDATIAAKLVAVKTKYDKENRIMEGTPGAPKPLA